MATFLTILKGIGAVVGLVSYILTWRFKVDEEKKAEAKQLEEQADEAIRSGNISRILGVWDRVR